MSAGGRRQQMSTDDAAILADPSKKTIRKQWDLFKHDREFNCVPFMDLSP